MVGALLVAAAPSAVAAPAAAPVAVPAACGRCLRRPPRRPSPRSPRARSRPPCSRCRSTASIAAAARSLAREQGGARALAGVLALSAPVPAPGFATVGAVWDAGAAVSGRQVAVRTRTSGAWSSWTAMHADAEHGPDPGTAEAAGSRPGTDPYVVGDVDAVQLRMSGAGRCPGARRPDPRRDRSRRRPAQCRHASREARLSRHGRPRPGDAAARHLLPAPVGRQRADARRVRRLRRDHRLVRAPHRQRQRLRRRPRCRRSCAPSTPTTCRDAAGATSATTSWSTASAGSGRGAGAASAARSSARTPWATTRSRSRCRRSATTRLPNPRKAMLRAYARLYAWKLSLYGVAREGVGAHRRARLPGDQRPPGRGGDRLSGPAPVRPARQHP